MIFNLKKIILKLILKSRIKIKLKLKLTKAVEISCENGMNDSAAGSLVDTSVLNSD